MAKQQHVEWLLEGVDAWNSRRTRDDFTPELSGLNSAEAGLKNLSRCNLSGSQLQNAQIRNVHCAKTDFRDADLSFALLAAGNVGVEDVMMNAIFDRATLNGATLTGGNSDGVSYERVDLRNTEPFTNSDAANFRKTDLRGTSFSIGVVASHFHDADVRTLVLDDGTLMPTDLSGWTDFHQHQLDTMRGDRGAILPEGLTHPDHWDEPEPPAKTTPAEVEAVNGGETPEARAAFRAHVAFILQTAPAAIQAAEFGASQIEWAIQKYRSENGYPNTLPPELEAFAQLGQSYRAVASVLRGQDARDKRIAELEISIAEMRSTIATLTAALANLKKVPPGGS